jgi:Glycosyltransferase sugar-binding region containing DXD motif
MGTDGPLHKDSLRLVPLLMCLLLLFIQTDYLKSKRGALRPLSRQVRNPEYPRKDEDEQTIPRTLIFTYKSKLDKTPKRLYNNVMHTINVYRKAWNDKDAPVLFLDNQDCLEVIEEVEPKLAIHFRQEDSGAFKADICRLAVLYARGGYYFDIDMQAVQAVPVSSNIAFASVHAAYGGFFQSFLASAPESPIIKKALTHLRDYYEEKARLKNDYENFLSLTVKDFVAIHQERLQWKVPETVGVVEDNISARMKFRDAFQAKNRLIHLGTNSDLVGPGSLRVAYDEVMGDKEQTSLSKKNTLMLDEIHLEDGIYPHMKRQPELIGKACNYIVHNPEKEQVYFFSRIVGVPHCPLYSSGGKAPKSEVKGGWFHTN